jgi:hypothetical protein
MGFFESFVEAICPPLVLLLLVAQLAIVDPIITTRAIIPKNLNRFFIRTSLLLLLRRRRIALIYDNVGINTSAYSAGGLASRKPEKNKGITLSSFLFFILPSFVSSFSVLRMNSLRHGWRSETNKRGAKESLNSFYSTTKDL